MILYSIDGTTQENAPQIEEVFHGFPVLGKIDVKEPSDRAKIIATLNEGIAKSDSDPPPACFWPRHAIHAEQQGKIVDYVICFECLQLRVYKDGDSNTVRTTRAPEAVFNAFLTHAEIRIAP